MRKPKVQNDPLKSCILTRFDVDRVHLKPQSSHCMQWPDSATTLDTEHCHCEGAFDCRRPPYFIKSMLQLDDTLIQSRTVNDFTCQETATLRNADLAGR